MWDRGGGEKINLNLYGRQLRLRGTRLDGSKFEQMVDCDNENITKIPLLREFLDDDDIQEISVFSLNIGFSQSYSKMLKDGANP